MTENVLIEVAGVLILGITAQAIAPRLRLPSILILLAFGFIAGPVTGFLHVDDLLGDLLFPLVSLSVGIILFEGGLGLKISDISQTGRVIRNLITVGALATWVLSSAGAYFILDLNLAMAVQFGAVLVVTGPTVIGPLLRFVRPKGQVASILRWEGILIDPVGATLAVLVFNAILIGDVQQALGPTIADIILTIVVGGLAGWLAARALVFIVRHYLVPDYLQNPLTLMLVVGVFALSETIQHESGLLATTVMGMALANQNVIRVRRIIEFKENIGIVLISSLFILLAARLQPSQLAALDGRALLFIAFMMLVVRPVSVLLSAVGSTLNARERLFIAWMAPRGIVAAAVSSIFSLRLTEVGHPQAELLVPLTFAVIIVTCAVYGLTSLPLARRLDLSLSDPQGVLIVGAHDWAREIAGALQSANQQVRLIDTNYSNVQAAKLMNLDASYGSAIAEESEELNLDGIGRLMALTSNDEVNSLSALHFAELFGRKYTYQLPLKQDIGVSRDYLGRLLFNPDADFNELNRRFTEGAVVKATSLTKTFDYNAYKKLYGDSALPMFLIDSTSGRLSVFTVDSALAPQPGQTIIALVDATALSQQTETPRMVAV